MIKDWNKLTIEELDALTPEQEVFYQKLLLAEAGVAIVEKPNEIDTVETPEDLTVYFIPNFSENIYFKSIGEAEAVLDTLRKCPSLGHLEYQEKSGYDKKYFEPGAPVDYFGRPKIMEIQAKAVYSKEVFRQMQDTLVINERLRKQYHKDKEEYEKNLSASIEVTNDFNKALDNARSTMRRRRMLSEKFNNNYMPLAEKDYDIAMNFMKKAYNISEEDEKFIKTHISDVQV